MLSASSSQLPSAVILNLRSPILATFSLSVSTWSPMRVMPSSSVVISTSFGSMPAAFSTSIIATVLSMSFPAAL